MLPTCIVLWTVCVQRFYLQAKLSASKLRVWEKTTASSRVGRAPRLPDIGVPETPSSALITRTSFGRGIVAAATDALSKERRREPKETMSNFIAQKREMFFVQMALDTKRQEIQKLEQKALAREDSLKKSELLLEEVTMTARSCARCVCAIVSHHLLFAVFFLNCNHCVTVHSSAFVLTLFRCAVVTKSSRMLSSPFIVSCPTKYHACLLRS